MLRTILIAAILLGGSAGCSTDLHTPPHVLCRDRSGCLSDERLAETLQTFHETVAAAFDTNEDLVVYWYPTDTVFWETADSRVIGFTDSPDRVHVTSVPVLVHEVMHVHLWRMFPEYRGDADHEAGGGPWTEATNDAVREVVSVLENANEQE